MWWRQWGLGKDHNKSQIRSIDLRFLGSVPQGSSLHTNLTARGLTLLWKVAFSPSSPSPFCSLPSYCCLLSHISVLVTLTQVATFLKMPTLCQWQSNHSGPIFSIKSSSSNPTHITVSLLETCLVLYNISIMLQAGLNNVCRSCLLQLDWGLSSRVVMSSHLQYHSEWQSTQLTWPIPGDGIVPIQKAQRWKSQETREGLII